MEDLQIKPTKKTPLVDFEASGKLLLSGSAYPENAKEFFDPIIHWVSDLQVEEITLDMILEYMNTSAAKKIWELLKILETSDKITNKHINWHYQEWDDDNLETGKILSESLTSINFNFIKTEDSKENK